MDLEWIKVIESPQMEALAATAKEIWQEYFPGIISMEQVHYMVEKFQSFHAIERQISHDGYQYFMLHLSKEILGYLGFQQQERKLFLSKLYLKKKFRGKGYFTLMLSFIENFARKNNVNHLYLTVNKQNTHSIAVYQHKGFSISKEQTANIGNGFAMDDYVMEKRLQYNP